MSEDVIKIAREPFEGRDQREVIQEAIDWIENYFNDLEKEYKEHSN